MSLDLSIIITAHGEGLLAHKTMRSVQQAAEVLKSHGVSHEILIHLDRPDAATKDYFESHKKQFRLRLIYGDFGDLGLSRNNAAKQAKGNYLAFLDADDLISPNYYYQVYKQLTAAKSPVILHPAYSLTFGVGVPLLLWSIHGSYNYTTDAFLSAGVNLWPSVAAASRQLFLDHPYPSTKHGYGNEDYYFNTETLAAGIKHRVAKDTILFYRRRANSLLAESNDQQLVQRATKLLDVKTFQKLNPQDLAPEIASPPPYILRLFRLRRSVSVPPVILDIWRDISRIEPQLYPTAPRLKHLIDYHPEKLLNFGRAYHALIQPVTTLPDEVLIASRLTPSNLNFIHTFAKKHSKKQLAIITTLPSKSQPLPENCCHLDFGNIAKRIKTFDRPRLFARLLEQLHCKNLTLSDPEFAYRFVLNHLDLIKYNYQLNLFISDPADPTTSYATAIAPVVHHIHVPDQQTADRLVEAHNFDSAKFVVRPMV